MSSNHRRLEFLFATLYFSLFSCIVLTQANPFLYEPGRDGGFFMYAGRQVFEGKTLYMDVWDSKGPLIFYINALGLLLGKNSRWGIWAMEFLFWTISSLLGYTVIKRRWGVLPAIFGMSVALMAGKQLIEKGNFTEEYALLFTWISLYAFNHSSYTSNKKIYPTLIGAMLALNFLLRANNIGTSVLVALLYGIQLWRQNGLSKALKKSIWILVGLLMVLAPVTAYFYSLGTLDEMFAASILYNFDYSFQTRPNTGSIQLFQGAILPGHKILRIWMLLPLIGYLLAIYQAAKRFKTKQLSAFDGLLLLAWPVEITASAISGRGYGHYFLLWLPAIGLLSGLLFHYVNQFILSAQFVDLMERRKPILAFMLGFFILGYAFPKPISQNWASAEQILFNRAQGIELQTPIAQYIGQHTTPEETVLVWGGQAGINFLSKRDSSTAYVFYPMLANTRFGKELQNRFYDDLTNRPPSLIVDASLHTPKLAPALDIKVYRNEKLLYPLAENLGDVLDYIDQNYVKVAEVQGYPVYARKSGQINP